MQLHQGFVTGEMGFGRPFTLQKPDPPMSALGHKRTCRAEIAMSALPLKADIRRRHRDVSFGPNCDICSAAIDRGLLRYVLPNFRE
jgi:hypothetical protein